LRVAEAILGGALAGASFTTLGLFAFNLANGMELTFPSLLAAGAWFGVTFLIAVGFASTLGLAWYALASGRGWHSAHHYWVPGAVTGAIPLAIAFSTTATLALSLGLYGAAMGGLTGLFAWLIRRPDRDAIANPPTSPA
jgi:hypothetical protein